MGHEPLVLGLLLLVLLLLLFDGRWPRIVRRRRNGRR